MPRAFIAMPFAKEFYPVYQAIRLACLSVGIEAIRIDEVWAKDDIYQEIEKEILQADLVIVDFTGDRMLDVPNPNVVHEAAFARTNKKFILLLAQDPKSLPFDWRTRPATIYSSTWDGLHCLSESLKISLEAFLKQQGLWKDEKETVTSSANIQSKSDMILPPCFQERDGMFYSLKDNEAPMAIVSGGIFTMGSNEEEDQKPVRSIHLDPYLIDVYPVTWRQYHRFCEETKCTPPPAPPWGIHEDHPVVGVSWYEAKAYASWAGKNLPTETQWERAARGTDDRIYPWGNDPPGSLFCNFKRHHKGTTPVNQFSKGISPVGCYDMAGNIWEWCEDWYGAYQSDAHRNPKGPEQGEYKVSRGGSWSSESVELKVSFRYYSRPGNPDFSLTRRDKGQGFRCAREFNL